MGFSYLDSDVDVDECLSCGGLFELRGDVDTCSCDSCGVGWDSEEYMKLIIEELCENTRLGTRIRGEHNGG